MGLFEQVFGNKLSKEIARSGDDDRDDYNKLLNECVAEVVSKNQKLVDEYSFGEFEEWSLDQEVGQLVFSEGGIRQLLCSVTILGSYSEDSKTWMWGWANPSLLEPLTRDTQKVRDFGGENKIDDLVFKKVEATEAEAWAFCALSCRILDGLGLYRGPTGNGFVVMMLKSIERCE